MCFGLFDKFVNIFVLILFHDLYYFCIVICINIVPHLNFLCFYAILWD